MPPGPRDSPSLWTQDQRADFQHDAARGLAVSIKALMDARKITKVQKDMNMHDCIVPKTDDPNALHELETFDLQISRTKMMIYRLHKIQLAAAAISRLLTGLVALKKSMEAMDTKIAT
ncbi:hypothetical protein BGZ98_000729 [Dissophora globulifera]|nr:hypothetical protein BGZ98_000729 [Dissophora globulifera]